MRILITLWMLFTISIAGAKPVENYLWKIQKNGQAASYIVGTIHVNNTSYTPSKALSTALSNVDVLLTEAYIPINQQEANNKHILKAIQSSINLKHAKQLTADLGKKRAQNVISYYQNHKQLSLWLPVAQNQYGWTALMLISSASPVGLESQYGVDFQLSQLAAQQQIKRKGLESTEASMDIFRNIPLDKIRPMIDQSLRYSRENDQMTAKMVDLYNHQQIAELIEWSLDEQQALKYVPQEDKAYWREWFYKTLLKQRNQQWLPKIEQHLTKQPTMIAVGLLHLPTESGLLALLREKGYTVTAIE